MQQCPRGGDTALRAVDSSFVSRFTGSIRKGKKSRAALALAVSLWMAGGSVAGAAEGDVWIDANDGDKVVVYNPAGLAIPGTITPGEGETATNKTLTVSGGDWSGDDWGIYGGAADDDAPVDASGYTLSLTDCKGISGAYGGYTAGNKNASNNKVSLTGTSAGVVFGGRISRGQAINNQVSLTNSEVTNLLQGGYRATNLSTDIVAGNKLYLSGANTFSGSDGSIKNFETIYLTGTAEGDENNWRTAVDTTWGTPVLTLKNFGIGLNEDVSKATIDASTLTFADPQKIGKEATMDLIKCEDGATIVATIAAATTTQDYTFTPVSGVSIGATLTGNLAFSTDANDKNIALTYTAASNEAATVTLGADIPWNTETPLYTKSAEEKYTFANDAAIDASKLTFTGIQTAKTGDAMTLLSGATGITGNHIKQPSDISYEISPLYGVTINGAVTGEVAVSGANVNYQVTGNNASKLTFANVEWKDSGALLTRPANITFAGAAVDTTNINFTNIKSLDAGKKMTLVSDFGNSVGTITGTKYKVGTTLEGTGKASLSGSDLIFTAETGTTQPQTHNTVMGAEVGMAALSMGNDFIGAATQGLSLASNTGADGVSSFAQMGGGSMRQETGSHVDTHTWNAILALGHQNKKERGTMEYGAFFEYGTGNYTTHNGDERGDGSTHYTGGGLLAKWTANHGMYVEGSLRAGSVHDDARNVLRDVRTRVPYSYETNAPYMGFHLGVGKEIAFDDMHAVDVYGRYFYNRRNGVSFDAGGHYDLDAVTSQVIRVGARYIVKRDKWNFYAGAAYEHELDGKAAGKADGVAIRGADTSGASLRGELGATMKPGENSPWSLDLNVSGFAGKKRGFTGGVSVAFMF